MSLFGVLKQADPALVDPGVTAQLECLLDDVVVGKQEMVGAIDAVCNVAERIIGKLKEGATAGGPPLLGAAVGDGLGTFPPTPAMKRFADSLARQKGIKPPPSYKTSISICRKFLSEHAPKKAEGETRGKLDSKPVSPGTDVVRQEDRAGERPRRSRGDQGQLGCYVCVDKLEPKREAPQARSQDRLQAGRISCASIDRDDEEVSETQTGCLCRSSRRAKFGYRYVATDSLWQQGGRSPAIARVDGMPHPGLIFLHSESADGFNAWRARPSVSPDLTIASKQRPVAQTDLRPPPMRSKMSSRNLRRGAIAALRITLIADAFLEAEIDRLSRDIIRLRAWQSQKSAPPKQAEEKNIH